ncbi:uncharacterized protein LOC115210225 [Argonauta hians]
MANKFQPKYPKDTVLIAVNDSSYADYAVSWYCQHIHRPGNEVILVHCMDSSDTSDASVRLGREEQMLELEKGFIDKMSSYGVDATIRQINGKPGEAICKAAEEECATVIITGTRGLGKLKRTFLGSVSDYIVHHATVPVLVCKSGEEKEKDGDEEKKERR